MSNHLRNRVDLQLIYEVDVLGLLGKIIIHYLSVDGDAVGHLLPCGVCCEVAVVSL